MRQHPHLATVTQKQDTREDIVQFVTYCNIWLKCYITFCNIVADGKRGSNVLANAIDKLWLIIFKKLKSGYSFFVNRIIISLFSADMVQRILSLSFKSNAFTISTGIVVLNDLEWDVCKFAVDSNSNNFIPPYLLFFVNIFVNILYIILPI